ncbi:hypothetical protein C3E98_044355, partial [Pseudomonas sp. MWU13-2625]
MGAALYVVATMSPADTGISSPVAEPTEIAAGVPRLSVTADTVPPSIVTVPAAGAVYENGDA